MPNPTTNKPKAAGAGNTNGSQKNKDLKHSSTGIGGGNPSGLRANPMSISFVFPGAPVPAMRPRHSRNGTYNPKRYTAYKKAFSEALKQKFGHLAKQVPPAGSKERTAYLASHRYRLIVEVHRLACRGDADNFLKTVQDAIQQAGIIGDDSQFDEVYCRKLMDKQNPRISFCLERLDREPVELRVKTRPVKAKGAGKPAIG